MFVEILYCVLSEFVGQKLLVSVSKGISLCCGPLGVCHGVLLNLCVFALVPSSFLIPLRG